MIHIVKEWSLVHAHFLKMGGFKVVFMEDERDDFKNKMVQRRDDGYFECVVRFETFKKLLEEGHIDLPHITEAEIRDKSKVDDVSKGLVLLQLFWFIAQILARAFLRLAITQLEIATAALATMDFVMYYFWWPKPLNAEHPEVIPSIGVYKCMNDNLTSRRLRYVRGNDTSKTERVGVKLKIDETTNKCRDGEIEAEKPNRCGETEASRHGSLWQNFRRARNFSSRVWCALDRVTRTWISIVRVRWLAPTLVAVAFATAKAALLIMTGSLIVALSWNAIHRGSEVETSYHTNTSKLYNWVIKVPGVSRLAQFVRYATKVNRSLFYSDHSMSTSRLPQVVAVLAGIVFGAIHCLAWNFDFPSHTEESIWRISSVVMISVNIYPVVGVSAFIKLRDFVTGTPKLALQFFLPEAELHYSPTLPAEENALIFLSIIFSSVVHAIARIALIILAMMSLRNLPPSAFQEIGWISLIPHI